MHELRTPLTAIRGYAQLLLRQTKNEAFAPLRPALQAIVDETEKLTAMTDVLLDAEARDRLLHRLMATPPYRLLAVVVFGTVGVPAAYLAVVQLVHRKERLDPQILGAARQVLALLAFEGLSVPAVGAQLGLALLDHLFLLHRLVR